jgi:hypothetical protein
MAKDTFTGPLIALGDLAGGPGGGTPREYSDELGPSIFYGGFAMPVTSANNASKDRMGPGAIASVFAAFPLRTINAAVTAGNAALTTAGVAVAGTPLVNLTAYNAGRAPVPIIAGGILTTGIALDMGLDAATFTTGATNNVTLTTVANAWRYQVGQWIGLLNGGASGATQMTQITAITISTGVLTVAPAPLAATTGQIALTNRFNPNLYGASGPPSSIAGSASAGSARLRIPEVANTRGIGITGTASGVATIFDILGIDGSGSIRTETIVGPTGVGTVWSKKTYDIFISATPRTADAHNYTVVTSDFIGFPLPVMSTDSIVAMTLGGAGIVAANFTVIPADLTFPSSPTTGDPNGGIQTTANGPAVALGLAVPGTPLAFTGTVLVVDQRLNPLQVALGGF